jgi:hypothetical protein
MRHWAKWPRIFGLGLENHVQWARKVYAAVAENYPNSKCYISGQRRARKALFSAFDAAWAGVSHDKISALKSVWFFYSRSTKLTKIFDLIFKLKNYATLT